MEPFRHYFRKCERCMGVGYLYLSHEKGLVAPCYICGGDGEYMVVIDTLGKERRVPREKYF